jgi:signal transduction histidine kinase
MSATAPRRRRKLDAAPGPLRRAFFRPGPWLGLAISSSIVRTLNGSLAARNLGGGRAQFALRLALTREGAAR